MQSLGKKIIVWFPSPTGVLYISMDVDERMESDTPVSVPYWGSLYFNRIYNIPVDNIFLFPSPTGVLYISMPSIVSIIISAIVFPSPTGVLYISIYMDVTEALKRERVSVPYWGSLYFNTFPLQSRGQHRHSFRPLLGFFIFQ